MPKSNYLYLCVLILLFLVGCSPKLFKEKWATQKAPNYFKAKFETTQGDFEIEAKREWSPLAVDRLYMLIKTGFYTDIALFRVVEGYVVQFGIHNDSTLNKSWRSFKIPDEQVIEKNTKGAISFARRGKETRSTQIFINLENNSPRLDTLAYSGVKGFPVIAQVTSGMDVVETFYKEYGNQPSNIQGEIQKKGNSILKEKFPKLDYIKKAYIIK